MYFGFTKIRKIPNPHNLFLEKIPNPHNFFVGNIPNPHNFWGATAQKSLRKLAGSVGEQVIRNTLSDP